MSFIINQYGIYSTGLLVKKEDVVERPDQRTRFVEASKQIAEGLQSSLKDDDASKVLVNNTTPKTAITSSGVSMLLGAAQSVISIATEAISAISDLQKQQLDNATKAASVATGSQTTDLKASNAAIDTEINRVLSAATYNGKNIFSQLTSITGPTAEGQNTLIVNLPPIGDMQFTSSVSLTSESTSASAVIALTNASVGTKQLESAFISAQGKISEAIQATSAERAADPEKVKETTAQDLAKKIADQIGSPFQNEFATKSLIEATTRSLTSDKVQDLIRPDPNIQN